MSRSLLVVDFAPQTASAVRASFRSATAASPEERFLELANVAEILAVAERYYTGLDEPALRALGQTLYRWLDGGDRLLTRLLEQLQPRPAVVTLAIVPGQTGLGRRSAVVL
jgi:hypothetical protein